MHLLVAGTTSPGNQAVALTLGQLGHTVAVCHEVEDRGTACAAVRGRPCPLEAQPIDAVITTHPSVDDAVLCARRRRVPVAFVADAVASRSAVARELDSATGELVEHAAVADLAARSALTHVGVSVDLGLASVIRRAGGLHVTVEVPASVDGLPAPASQRPSARRTSQVRSVGPVDRHRGHDRGIPVVEHS